MTTAYAIAPAPASLIEVPFSAIPDATMEAATKSATGLAIGATRWAWACRVLTPGATHLVSREQAGAPRAGDLAMVEVEEIGSHERITTSDNLRLRIYPGDRIVGVFGNRYATDAYEGEVEDIEALSLLTAGGMIGTVKSRHRSTGRPTRVRFLGYVAGPDRQVINLKSVAFHPAKPLEAPRNVVAVVGTGMNAGKTTSCVKLIKGLADRGFRVAACKLTGSVSNRDQDEMRSASAVRVLDFSDYGFPSTYLCEKGELMTLFDTLMAAIEPAQPDITVMEIADGILQRETAMLLEDARLRETLAGAVLAADNALSARFALDRLEALGHKVIAVTGLLTSSPLCTREFAEISRVPVASSAGDGGTLGATVSEYLRRTGAQERNAA